MRRGLERRELSLELGDARGQRVAGRADAVAPGPPLGTYGLRVPASRAGCVPEAQGGLPSGPRVLYVLGTRTNQPRAYRTYRVPWHPRWRESGGAVFKVQLKSQVCS